MKTLLITIMLFNSVNMYPIKSTPQTEPKATTKRGALLLSIKSDKVSRFFNNHFSAAEKLQNECNIPIQLSLAQWALESGFGTSKIAKEKLNFGGIKGANGYKCYSSIEEFYNDYKSVLNAPCYQKIDRSSLALWLDAVQHSNCYYASSKNYKNKLESIIKKYNLYKL